jgi:hypothetical protein
MSDILATHKQLLAAGLSEDQSRSFLRLVADAEGGAGSIAGRCRTISPLLPTAQPMSPS